MMDPRATHAPEQRTIDLKQAGELGYWLKELRCSEEELRHAVAAYGNGAQVVRSWIQQVRHGGQ
jgi:hypothetical protein